jgi:hypothetical protein
MSVRTLSKTQWLVLILCLVTLGLGVRTAQLKSELNRTNDDLTHIGQVALLRTANQSQQATAERAVIDPISSSVYLPEFRVKLPYDSVSKTIAYVMRNDIGLGDATVHSAPEADLTSIKFVPSDIATKVDCSSFVRLKLEAKPNPYSPHEKAVTVNLGGGKSLQVYETVNVKECQATWNQLISPSDLANELKKAESY